MLKGDVAEGDGGFAIGVEGIYAEELGFGLVNGKKEELSSAFEGEDEALQTLSGVADDSHVVSIQEDLEEEVDLAATNGGDAKLAINSVSKSYTIGGVGKGKANNVVKENCEESGGEDASLTYAIVRDEGFGEAAVGADRGVRVGVEVLKEAENFGGKAGALTDKPGRITVDLVIGLQKVYEAGVDWDTELEGTAENLAEDEELVCGTAVLAKARLVLENGGLHAL